MPTIRTIAITAIFALVLTYMAIGFFGGYQYANNIQMNGTLAGEYNSIINNPTQPGGIFDVGNLISNTNTYQNKFQNVTGFFAAAAAATGAISYVVGFIVLIPTLFYTIILFASAPLIALGIPTAFAVVMMTILLIIMILLSIASAVLIFPIIIIPGKGDSK